MPQASGPSLNGLCAGPTAGLAAGSPPESGALRSSAITAIASRWAIGVYELKFDAGPGYRVYFGIDGDEIILLGGGDKSTQVSDIRKAKGCWKDYNA
jgi:hypothetical protein